jgi:hypothetical protein
LRQIVADGVGVPHIARSDEVRAKQQLDADTDAGGARRLLSVDMVGDEPLVALEVRDPSTGRVYLLRVPPEMTTCRQAAAWIAAFDDLDDYRPLLETLGDPPVRLHQERQSGVLLFEGAPQL